MKSQGLSNQIQREIKAHPVKAGVLALALLVALWFWAPLVIGWLPKSGATKSTAAAPEIATPGGPATGLASAAADPLKWNPTWSEMVGWICHDELMRPAGALENGRDPFRTVAPAPSAEQASKPVTAPKLDPKNLGLELTGTLIGSRQSVATINGRTYILPRTSVAGSERVEITIKQQDQQYQFTLLQIEPDGVQLEFQGRPLSLKVKDKQLKGKTIELNEKSTIEIHDRVLIP